MAADAFDFKPAEVPQATRGLKKSRYAATVDAVHAYLQEHADQRAVQIELGSVGIKAAAASFRAAIKKHHPDDMRLAQRGGELFVERK